MQKYAPGTEIQIGDVCDVIINCDIASKRKISLYVS